MAEVPQKIKNGVLPVGRSLSLQEPLLITEWSYKKFWVPLSHFASPILSYTTELNSVYKTKISLGAEICSQSSKFMSVAKSSNKLVIFGNN